MTPGNAVPVIVGRSAEYQSAHGTQRVTDVDLFRGLARA